MFKGLHQGLSLTLTTTRKLRMKSRKISATMRAKKISMMITQWMSTMYNHLSITMSADLFKWSNLSRRMWDSLKSCGPARMRDLLNPTEESAAEL